jgi:hypothetical protein
LSDSTASLTAIDPNAATSSAVWRPQPDASDK